MPKNVLTPEAASRTRSKLGGMLDRKRKAAKTVADKKKANQKAKDLASREAMRPSLKYPVPEGCFDYGHTGQWYYDGARISFDPGAGLKKDGGALTLPTIPTVPGTKYLVSAKISHIGQGSRARVNVSHYFDDDTPSMGIAGDYNGDWTVVAKGDRIGVILRVADAKYGVHFEDVELVKL